MTHFLIAVTAYGGSIKNGCVASLLDLSNHLKRQGVDETFRIGGTNGIDLERNFFATLMLNDRRYTHLLFIDYDMIFHSDSVMRMLQANKPVIGCIYPRKTAKPQFVVKLDDGKLKNVDAQGLCKVTGIGMGLALIRRDAIEKLSIDRSIRTFTGHPFAEISGPLYGLFDQPRGDISVGEDIAFCNRWTACGGEVWALANEDIGHIGEHVFRGTLLDAIRSTSG